MVNAAAIAQSLRQPNRDPALSMARRRRARTPWWQARTRRVPFRICVQSVYPAWKRPCRH